MIKIKRLKKGKQDYIEVDSKSGSHVADVIHEMIHDYIEEHGEKPAGIAIGATEYLSLSVFLSERAYTMWELSYPANFEGVLLCPKEFPGIELLIPASNVLRYIPGAFGRGERK